jgi:hypothetical protein
MLNCKETTRLLSVAQDRTLGFRERFDLKLHLLMCRGCTNYREQMDFLRKACGRLKNNEKEPSP